MRIARLIWDVYRLPFAAGFRTAHGSLATRTGIVLRLVSDRGAQGLGEIAPLPPFGGQLDDALALLRALAPALVGKAVESLPAAAGAHPALAAFPPATQQIVLAGIDLGCADLLAQAAGQPLARWLGAQPPPTAVPVNATIGAPTAAAAAEAARQARSAGFGCVKLKVGSATLAEEIARVAAVRAALGPAVELRLDANGAWSVSQAVETLTALQPYAVALVEQPTPPHDPLALAEVRRSCPHIMIAADESAGDASAIERLLAVHAADAIVIKPMLLGGLRTALALARRILAAGGRVIVTSLLDSGIGVVGALHLAAALPPPVPVCGLATTALLHDDLIHEALTPQHGNLNVPRTPGLGVTLDTNALARYRTQGGMTHA